MPGLSNIRRFNSFRGLQCSLVNSVAHISLADLLIYQLLQYLGTVFFERSDTGLVGAAARLAGAAGCANGFVPSSERSDLIGDSESDDRCRPTGTTARPSLSRT